MRIKVKDLEPNPFRRMEHYPIDPTKVRDLKASIANTTFWDNLLVRPDPNKKGKYQMAYGHHRHIALKELKIEEIDVPVRNIEDAMMLKIMANENFDTWKTNTTTTMETVRAAKDFLDNELKNYDDWKALGKYTQRFIDKFNFNKAKKEGVGWKMIQNFLGNPPWKEWIIRDVLDIIKDPELDQEAIKEFQQLSTAREFKDAIKVSEIPKKEQKKVAEAVKEALEDKKTTVKTIKEKVEEIAFEKKYPKFQEKISEEEAKWKRLGKEIQEISRLSKSLKGRVGRFLDELKEMKATSIPGPIGLIAKYDISRLLKTMTELYDLCLSSSSDSITETKPKLLRKEN